MARIALIDNHDSFVYNLVDALAGLDHELAVYRNTVPADTVLVTKPDLLIFSPGPGHPRDAGSMMELIARGYGEIPMLGICLGFQAILEHFGAKVAPCGSTHGVSVPMTLSDKGARSPLFRGLTIDSGSDLPGVIGRRVPVARYHSLGATLCPDPLISLATTTTDAGEVIMAAAAYQDDVALAIGFQFHPESILTPGGPIILERSIAELINH